MADVGFAVAAILSACIVTHVQFWRGSLISWQTGVFHSQGRGDMWDVLPVYWTASVLTLGFGGVLGGSIKTPTDLAPLAAAFLTLTGIGMFKVLCVLLPGQTPNTVVVWMSGALALGLYLLYSTGIKVQNDNVIVALVGGSILAIAVELLIAAFEEGYGRGWFHRIPGPSAAN